MNRLIVAVLFFLVCKLSFSLTPKLSNKNELLRKAFIQNVKEQLALKLGVPENRFQVDVDNLQVSPSIELIAVERVQILGWGTELSRRLDGLFSMPLQIESKEGDFEVQASGILKITGPVAIVKNHIQRSQMLQEADLVYTDLPWKSLPTGAMGVSVKNMIGRRAKSLLNPGSVVYLDLLEEADLIKSGDAVEIVVQSGPGVIIRSKGVARQEGKVGDYIKVEQPDTKKVMSAQVVGNRSVEVRR